ncbi:MAG: oligosaccharide flippase family protein, partial [Anaerolineae bacterium]
SLAAGGGAILLAPRPAMGRRTGRVLLWSILPIALTAGELFILGHGFNPAVEPALLSFKPPAVAFLESQPRPFRLTTFNAPGEKTFNANAGMFYGLEDVRGYDSIITKQYVEYMERIAPQANELLYNRIAPIYIPQYDALNSRLLDLLNVRYVMTTHTIPNQGYRLVYQGEVLIYENLDALPRAFFVARERILPRPALLESLPALEPTQEVLLEEAPAPADQAALQAGRSHTPYRPADAVRYSMNSVEVDITADGAGWLVLADSYFPGWKAYVRPLGGTQDDEAERTIYRADGNFRAVRLDAGRYTVRFVYTPMSFKIGLFITFLAGVVIFLLLAYYVWRKAYREEESEDALLKRVAKNSLTPMILSLVNKAIDFAFAMLRLRILEPVGEGRYTFAIIFIGYFEILTLFGLGTLLTREVSKDKSRANRYLSNTVVLRLILWLAALPLMALVAYIYYRLGALTPDTASAIGLFAAALFFSNISEVLSAVFYAHERMEIPAGLSAVTNVLKVSLGTLALLIGWGFVGLAGVSVVVNIFTAGTLFLLMRRLFFRPRLEIEPAFQREMLRTSYPLMINHLLATVFFRIDMLLLKPMQGDRVVGYYSAAYKYIDGLNIIPAYFTLAIFPVMSRFAESARDSLKRAYIASLKFLLMVSLPIAAGTPFIARELILILGGGKFLPHSMIALQLLIGFLPFSYINSVTQYVLIALDEQRFLTKAFLIGVSFNFIAHLLFIPRFGYQAAAVITVLSEIVLLMPFYYCVRRNIGPLPWPAIVWRPALSAGVMAAGLWLTASWNIGLRLVLAAVLYISLLVLLGAFREPDMQAVLKLMPWGRLRDALRRRIGLRPAGEP